MQLIPLSLRKRGLGVRAGDRVVINANLGCGECDACQSGRDNLCQTWHLLGETVRGMYCEYISLPVRQLCKIPDGFDYHQSPRRLWSTRPPGIQ
ncbi:MAG: alcohol dehydrogenase catalytic domain-containing protein [Chloroflexi bacterium]|nr:alcohol dehydrogenase catalytic domain-containing protein [Chloroflexota bacterium]